MNLMFPTVLRLERLFKKLFFSCAFPCRCQHLKKTNTKEKEKIKVKKAEGTLMLVVLGADGTPPKKIQIKHLKNGLFIFIQRLVYTQENTR